MMITPMRTGQRRAPRWCGRRGRAGCRPDRCPARAASAATSRLRTTLAVPRVNSQPKPEAAGPADHRHHRDRHRGQRPARDQERPERAAPPAGQRHRDEAHRQQRRQLHLRRHRDQHGARRPACASGMPAHPVLAAARPVQRSGQQRPGGCRSPRSANSVPASIRPSIRASLWMPATRCMNSSGLHGPSHSALTSATPQRRASRGVAHTISPTPSKHDEAVAQHRGDDVLAGERGDAAADPQEQRAVRGGCLAPQARHRQREDVVEAEAGRGPDPVRVEPDAARSGSAPGRSRRPCCTSAAR